MKTKTKRLAQQVRDALLALSDKVLMETIIEWLDRADERLQCLDWTDEFRYALGYHVQSGTTGAIYATFDELDAAEPDYVSISWVMPNVGEMRALLSTFLIEDVYHIVIRLAGYALSDTAYKEKWGHAPSSFSDGYDFMCSLAAHLRHKAYRGPEKGHVLALQDVAYRRKRMIPPDGAAPNFASRAVKVATLNDDVPATTELRSSHSQDLLDQNHDLDH